MLRGIRAGALLAAVALASLTVWFLRYDIIAPAIFLSEMRWYPFLFMMLFVWHYGSTNTMATRVAAPALLVVLSTIILAISVNASVMELGESGFLPERPIAIGATHLSLGVLAASDVLLRTHPARHRGGPHDIARWRPLASGETSRTASALTGLVTLALALAVALAPVRAVRPDRQLAPEPSEIPATPATMAGDLAWTLDLDEDDTIAAGAAGPILVTGSEIRGLDPADGSTRWAYNRPGARLIEWEHVGSDIITGPDRRYAAFATKTPDNPGKGRRGRAERAWVTVLDTVTGRIAAERSARIDSDSGLVSVQLTDTAALIGTEAIDLTTGTTLWTLPASETEPDYAGPAGHSTFILNIEENTSPLAAAIVLAPQDDPGRRTDLDNVSLDDDHSHPLVIDGWTIRYTAEPTDEDGGPTAAVNIDEVAAASGTDTVEGVDLGQTTGPDYRRSHTSLIATASDSSATRSTRPATVFDPVTRTVSPAEQSTTVDTARPDVSSDRARRERVLQLHMNAPDGPVTTDVAVTDDEFDELRRLGRDYGPDGPFRSVTLVAAPGTVLVHVDLAGSWPVYSNRLYAIR